LLADCSASHRQNQQKPQTYKKIATKWYIILCILKGHRLKGLKHDIFIQKYSFDYFFTFFSIDFIKIALHTCCKSCNKPQYHGPYGNFEKFNANDNSTLVVPIQSFENSKLYFGHEYIFMFKVNSVNLYEKFSPSSSASGFLDKLVGMAQTVKNTWPFFICLLWLCLLAGMIVSFIVRINCLDHTSPPPLSPRI